MKSVLLVGPLPPPTFGQAICLQILCNSQALSEHFSLISLNTNNVGKTFFARVLSTLRTLLHYARILTQHRPDLVYVTISRSKLGCVRDCAFMLAAGLVGARVVVHLHGGDLQVFYKSLRLGGKWLLRKAYGI